MLTPYESTVTAMSNRRLTDPGTDRHAGACEQGEPRLRGPCRVLRGDVPRPHRLPDRARGEPCRRRRDRPGVVRPVARALAAHRGVRRAPCVAAPGGHPDADLPGPPPDGGPARAAAARRSDGHRSTHRRPARPRRRPGHPAHRVARRVLLHHVDDLPVEEIASLLRHPGRHRQVPPRRARPHSHRSCPEGTMS